MPLTPCAKSPAASARQSFELAITIPTYNRSAQLASLLAQLADEAREARGRVVIVVSNNHSSDSTAALLGDYAKQHPDIAFEAYEQEQNIGPIPNIHFLVCTARSEWTWCLGDDDLLVDGGLRQVLSALSSIEGSLLLVRTTGIQEWDFVASVPGLRHVRAASAEGARCLLAAGFLASALLRNTTWRGLIERAAAFGAPNYSSWVAALLVASSEGRVAFLDEETVRGNANMVGDIGFARYAVLVLQRLRIWSELYDAGGAERDVANALCPLIAWVFRRGWRSIASSADGSLSSALEKVRGFATGARILGWPAAAALPWLVVALVLPENLRATLTRLCKRLAGKAGHR